MRQKYQQRKLKIHTQNIINSFKGRSDLYINLNKTRKGLICGQKLESCLKFKQKNKNNKQQMDLRQSKESIDLKYQKNSMESKLVSPKISQRDYLDSMSINRSQQQLIGQDVKPKQYINCFKMKQMSTNKIKNDWPQNYLQNFNKTIQKNNDSCLISVSQYLKLSKCYDQAINARKIKQIQLRKIYRAESHQAKRWYNPLKSHQQKDLQFPQKCQRQYFMKTINRKLTRPNQLDLQDQIHLVINTEFNNIDRNYNKKGTKIKSMKTQLTRKNSINNSDKKLSLRITQKNIQNYKKFKNKSKKFLNLKKQILKINRPTNKTQLSNNSSIHISCLSSSMQLEKNKNKSKKLIDQIAIFQMPQSSSKFGRFQNFLNKKIAKQVSNNKAKQFINNKVKSISNNK